MRRLVTLAAALVLVGCGDTEGPGSTAGAGKDATGSRVTLVADDLRWDTDCLRSGAGPLTIEVDNGSSAPISLDGFTVALTDSTGAAATITTGNSAAPFAGMMVEGGKAQGTYVFVVPQENRDPVTITMTYSTSSPAVVFAGPVASG